MYTLLTILLTAGTAAAAAAASAASGEPCSKLHNSTAVEPSPNTLEAFKSEKAYDNFASNVPVPLGYDSAFKNFNASVDSNAYLLYENLDSYDVEACADLCDKTRGCRAFNIYFERSPSLEVAEACPNPKANIVTRCALHAEYITFDQADNFGQSRGPPDASGKTFQTAIRGSNAYNRRISSSPLSSPSTVILTVTAPCTISASVETKTVTVAETLAIEQTQTVTRANSTATVTVTVAETLAVEQTQTITQPGVTQTKTIELVTLSTVVTKAVNGSVRRS